MEFKDRIKLLRTEKNISQQQLADALLISRSMIAKYETGLALPTLETIERIASYFNVEISSLLDCPNEVGIKYSYFKAFMTFHNVLYWFEIAIYSLFIILSFIPLSNGINMFEGAMKNHSPMLIIAFVYSIVCIAVLLVWRFAFKTIKSKMIISIFTDFSFFIGAFLIFVAIVMGVGGAQMVA